MVNNLTDSVFDAFVLPDCTLSKPLKLGITSEGVFKDSRSVQVIEALCFCALSSHSKGQQNKGARK